MSYYDLLTRMAQKQGPGGDSLQMTNQRRMIREDFAGVALDPAMWQVVQQGAGQSFAVAGSNLTIEAGTVPNAETIIRSVEAFPFPLRVGFIPMLSQRIINQEFVFELVDESGGHRAQIILDGTSATVSRFDTSNANVFAGSSFIGMSTSATLSGILELTCLQDTVLCLNDHINSTAVRNWFLARTFRIPDPNLLYHVQIRVRNLAVAPVSNTTLTLDAVTIENLSATTVEVLGGSGIGISSQGIAVHIPGTINIQSINTAFVETTAALGANGVFTGATRDFTATHRVSHFRAMSVSDQPGTLFIEYSADAAANTWAVILQNTATVVDADGITQHVATLSTPVPAQRGRTRYRNGATANTRLRVNSLQAGV